jgi:pimeloyl-ACP methyl ester carboxylesterase
VTGPLLNDVGPALAAGRFSECKWRSADKPFDRLTAWGQLQIEALSGSKGGSPTIQEPTQFPPPVKMITRLLPLIGVLTILPMTNAAPEQSFLSNGVRIHFATKGSGMPIVLIHGRGESLESWMANGVFQELAKDHHVIALDCRAHGTSGRPHDPAQYGREMALDVVRLLDHLQIFQAHVIGYSMGAMIASQLITLHPERFVSAVLGGGAGRLQWTEEDEKFYEQAAREAEQYGFSPSISLRIAPPGTAPMSADEIAKRSALELAKPGADGKALAAMTRSFHDQVIAPAQAAAVKLPTLGIVGAEDPMVNDLKKLQGLRPSMPVIVIDGATHGGARDVRKRPEFVAEVRKFISQVEAAGQ